MFHIDRVERLFRASCPSPLLHPSLGSALRASLRLFKFIPDEFVDPIEFSPVQSRRATPYYQPGRYTPCSRLRARKRRDITLCSANGQDRADQGSATC
jgi:hypothetical protein